jgi:STE24 endopeptidase
VTFSREQIERGRSYHRPRYLTELADFALGVAVLALLAFTGLGDALLPDWSWWAQALVYPAVVVGLLTIVRLPIAYWRDYVREHRWGLSTQSLGGWLADVAKGFAVSALLAAILLFGLIALARWSDAWPLVAGPLAAAFVVFFTFVAPVVLEPIFNKFEPLEDQELAADLRGLSERVGVPVRDVLVADASRRTTKSNAYVSGFGATRRVVLYDTLIEKASEPEVLTVVAHELGHRRFRHVAFGTTIAMAGAGAYVVVLWVLLSSQEVLDAIGASGPGDAGIAAFALLVGSLLGVFAAPFHAALSRRWEYACDRFALEQTGDLGAFELAFGQLSESNLPDSAPPHLAYLWLFSHPTIPERVAAARRAAALGTVPA